MKNVLQGALNDADFYLDSKIFLSNWTIASFIVIGSIFSILALVTDQIIPDHSLGS